MSVNLFRPKYEVHECVEEIRKVLESGWSGQGPKCAAFEEEFRLLIEATHCHFVSSATAALHLAVHLMNLPKGSRVATTPLTFVSTNAVLMYEGLEPVFCDCGNDLSLSFDSVRDAIENKAATAVMWVHHGGNVSPDFYKLMDYVKQHGHVRVVEDCAHASGAFYADGSRVGSRTDTVACFTGDVRVLMADGSQVRLDHMDESYVGKMVIGCVDNKCVRSRILGLVKHRKERHFRIVLDDKTSLICDEDHLFIVKRRGQWMDIPAKYLVEGDVVGKPVGYHRLSGPGIGLDEWILRSGACFKKPVGQRFAGTTSGCRVWSVEDGYQNLGVRWSSNRYDFSKTNLKELCYVCGLVFSDGHKSATGLRFTNTDEGLLDYACKFSARLIGREVNKSCVGDTNCKTVWIGGKLLQDMYEWFLSNWMEFSREGLLAFLSGIFDGDGSVYVSSNGYLQCSYATCDPEDAALVESIMRSLGMDVFVQRLPSGTRRWKSGHVSQTAESFIVRLFGKHASVVMDFGMVRHANKVRKYRKWDRKKSKDVISENDADLCLRRVTTIEDVEHDGLVYCINTETSNFVANGVLVHNCFSFHSVKNLPIFDGGMLVCPTAEMDARARRLSWMGIDKSTYARTSGGGNEVYKWSYDVPELGWKYNGNDVAAAIGMVQLKYLDRDNAYRRLVYERYAMRLAGSKKARLVVHNAGSSHHLVMAMVENREQAIASLKENGVAPGVHYLPNYMFPVFKDCDRSLCANVEKMADDILSLPNHLCMSMRDVDEVCRILEG